MIPEPGRWFQSTRAVVLALRVIAYEKTSAVAAIVWWAVSLLLVVPLLTVSAGSAVGFVIATVAVWFPFARWVHTQRFHLIRPTDRVEFAELGSEDESVVQRFERGVVLQRLHRDDVVRAGVEPVGGGLWYYLVKTPEKTAIVPFDWIVSIELDEGME